MKTISRADASGSTSKVYKSAQNFVAQLRHNNGCVFKRASETEEDESNRRIFTPATYLPTYKTKNFGEGAKGHFAKLSNSFASPAEA